MTITRNYQTLNLILTLILILSYPTTKQHAIVNTQLNMVTCSTYPE